MSLSGILKWTRAWASEFTSDVPRMAIVARKIALAFSVIERAYKTPSRLAVKENILNTGWPGELKGRKIQSTKINVFITTSLLKSFLKPIPVKIINKVEISKPASGPLMACIKAIVKTYGAKIINFTLGSSLCKKELPSANSSRCIIK